MNASASQANAPEEPQGRLAYKWKVLISVLFGIFMIILDTTVVNVAFQTLRREFNVSLSEAQWIISVYVLALGITTPLSGFLADRFGIKRMYISGLVLFVVGSALCGIAPTLLFLILARILQGIGGGTAQPLGPAMLYRTFPPNEQGVALGFFGIALTVAPALGPLLGGWLVDIELWRWIFYINVPIGILGIFLASRFLRNEPPTRKPALDPLGVITAVVGFGSLLYASTNAAELGWTSPAVVWGFAIGLVAIIAFAVIELFVAKEPLLELRLYKNRNFLLANLIGYVTVLALFGAEFLMPVYLQAFRGRTAVETGMILLALAISSGIVSPIAGRLYDRIGPRALVVAGFSILLINTWQLSQLRGDTSIGWIIFLLALRGVALGLTIQTTFATALASVPRNLLPRGSSLTNGTRFVIQSIGVALLATILSSTVSADVRNQQQQAQEQQAAAEQQSGSTQRFGVCETPGVAAQDNLPPGAAAQIAALPEAQRGPAQAQIRAGLQRACDENLAGFDRAYRFTFYASIAALLIGMLLPGWPFGWGGRASLAKQEGAPAPSAH